MAQALQPSTQTLSARPPTPDHQNQPARVLHLDAGDVDRRFRTAAGGEAVSADEAALAGARQRTVAGDGRAVDDVNGDRLAERVDLHRTAIGPASEEVHA